MNMPGLTDLLAHDMVKPLEELMYFLRRQTYSQEVWLCNIAKGVWTPWFQDMNRHVWCTFHRCHWLEVCHGCVSFTVVNLQTKNSSLLPLKEYSCLDKQTNMYTW